MKNKLFLNAILLSMSILFLTGCGSLNSSADILSGKDKNQVEQEEREKLASNEISTKALSSLDTDSIKNDYDLIMSLKPADYESYTVNEFHNYVITNLFDSENSDAITASYENVIGTIDKNDDNFNFICSLELTISEIYAESLNDYPNYMYQCFYKEGDPIHVSADGESVFEYLFMAPCNIYITLDDAASLTIKEKTNLFLLYKDKLQSKVDSLTTDEMSSSTITEKLQNEFDSVNAEVNTDQISFSNKIEYTEYLVN